MIVGSPEHRAYLQRRYPPFTKCKPSQKDGRPPPYEEEIARRDALWAALRAAADASSAEEGMDAIIERIAAVAGVTKRQLLDRSGSPVCGAARRACILGLHKAGFADTKVSHALQREVSTIVRERLYARRGVCRA